MGISPLATVSISGTRDSGEFPHADTDPLDDRYLFEIVQRIGGYQQHGAANALARRAARAKRPGTPSRPELLA